MEHRRPVGAARQRERHLAGRRGERRGHRRGLLPAPGALLLVFHVADPTANRLSLAFKCAPDDRFLGFGGQADGLDHRGHRVPIWTSEPGIGKVDTDDPPELWMLMGARHASSIGLPTWLSQRGYVGVVENDRRSVFDLCATRSDAWRIEVWDRELRLWLFHGPAPARAVERATAGVLGRQPRPPPLAFAPWNDAIFGSENVRTIARLLRREGIPSSVIWTEDFRGGKNVGATDYQLVENWDLDRTLYPDAESVAAELRADGFAWFADFNTFLVENTPTFDAATGAGHSIKTAAGTPYFFSGPTFEKTSLLDLSNPAARAFAKAAMHRALDVGFDGWMADFGEWLPHDAVLWAGEDPLAAHNRYAAEWVKLNAEALAERAGEGRQRLFFARAGWLGSARHVPVFWPGDQRTSFEKDDGLYSVIPMALNLGLAGYSTFGSDIAGYQSATNPPSTRELFFRWTTLGALSPVMRTHHGRAARANWWFGADEETLLHYKRWAVFLARLFPYLDGGAAHFEATGVPLMRALPLAFPGDAAGWSVSDQYLLGPFLWVAPVVEQSKTARRVHSPPGKWIPVMGGAVAEGPADHEVQAPLTEIPLYAAAGAVIPLLSEGVQTFIPARPPTVDLADVDGRRELWVFAGGAGAFAERDGTVYTLEQTGRGGEGIVENGRALPACAGPEARGCVEAVAGRTIRVRLAGQGPLEFEGHRLSISGSSRRMVDVEVHR